MKETSEQRKTEAWLQYEQGVNYKTRIGLYDEVNKNERNYAGDQWAGIPHKGLPTPVINVLKSGTGWKIAAVSERQIKLMFSVDGETETDDIKAYITQVNQYCEKVWERLKMDYVKDEVLKDAAISGDGIAYFPWDETIRTGQFRQSPVLDATGQPVLDPMGQPMMSRVEFMGDIACQLVDNVNYYPGNPNTPDVQGQPYIILAFRELVKNVKEEAERNGVSKDDLQLITGDSENDRTAGDRGKLELDDDSKCNVLLKMWKKDGRVHAEKSTRLVVVKKEYNTKLERYPVALMNWEPRKNCCHGVSEMTAVIPNQVYLNKIASLAQVSQMNHSFPKPIINKSKIVGEWSSDVSRVIESNGDIQGAAAYLNPGTISYDVKAWFTEILSQTFNMMGANDAVRGVINDPDNTSAFIAVRDAAMVPLANYQQRFYSFVEDVGLIWLDYMKSYYAGREIPVTTEGVTTYVPMPDLSQYVLTVKTDVGQATTWSQIQSLQTIDGWAQAGMIRPSEYFEAVKKFHLVDEELLNKLIAKRQQEEAIAAQIQQMQPTA